jgi:hypothetical protein
MTTKGKIILGVAAAALVGLYAASPGFRGLIRWGYDQAQNARYRVSQNASQGQGPSDARRDQLAQDCRNRMTAMEGAKRALLSERGYVQAGAAVTVTDIAERLGCAPSELVCPETGEAYILGGIAESVRCRVGNHGTPTYTADDHIIRP